MLSGGCTYIAPARAGGLDPSVSATPPLLSRTPSMAGPLALFTREEPS